MSQRIYRLRIPKTRPVRWIAFDIEGYYATENSGESAEWPSPEAVELVKEALSREQGLEVELVEGCA